MASDTYSLIMSAPDDEATFLSLAYIEELLFWFKRSHPKNYSNYLFDEGNNSAECWGISATAQISSIVRSRVEAERYFENMYFDDNKRIQVLGNPFESIARPTTALETSSIQPERVLSASNEIKTRRSRTSSLRALSTKPCHTSEQPEKKNDSLSSLASLSPPPLGMLWIGLFRALGFPVNIIMGSTTDVTRVMTPPTPAAAAAIMEDDLVLGRELCNFSAYPLNPNKDARVLGYMLRDDDALRYTALVEWFEDLLAFIVDNDYSCQQARCVLLDALALLRSLEGLPEDATEEDVQQTVKTLMVSALNVQACPVSTQVYAPHMLFEPVTGQMRDPKLTASIEHRLQTDKKLDKRQRMALMETLENAPLHAITVMEPRRTELPFEMDVRPYFSAADVEDVLDFLISSAVTHWRLFTFLLSQSQSVDLHSTTLVLEDILPCFVPPLSEFVSDADYDFGLKKEALMRQAYDEATATFNEIYGRTIEVLHVQEVEERQRLMAIEEAARQKNIDDALSQEEYKRVERAYSLHIKRTLGVEPFLSNTNIQEMPCWPVSPAATAASASNAAPSPPSSRTPPTVGRLPNVSRPSPRQHKGLRRSTASTAALPLLSRRETDKDCQDPARFVLGEVEKRVEKIETCANELLSESAAVRNKSIVRRM